MFLGSETEQVIGEPCVVDRQSDASCARTVVLLMARPHCSQAPHLEARHLDQPLGRGAGRLFLSSGPEADPPLLLDLSVDGPLNWADELEAELASEESNGEVPEAVAPTEEKIEQHVANDPYRQVEYQPSRVQSRKWDSGPKVQVEYTAAVIHCLQMMNQVCAGRACGGPTPHAPSAVLQRRNGHAAHCDVMGRDMGGGLRYTGCVGVYV